MLYTNLLSNRGELIIQFCGRTANGRLKQKRKDSINIAAWNVRTLQDNASAMERRTAILAKELNRYNIDIVALSETRLPDSGQLEERGSGYTFFWSGRPRDEHRQAGVGFAIRNKYIKLLDKLPLGINDRLMTLRLKMTYGHVTIISAYAPTMTHTDETKEEFYEELDRLIEATPHADKLLLLGDFNARVGCDHISWNKVLGHHGIGKENSNGTLLLTLCATRQLVITNTLFQQKTSYKTTWSHPRSGHWHQIDFVIIRQRNWHDVKSTRALKGTTCLSDHALIRSKVSFSFKQKRRHQRTLVRKLNIAKLSSTTTHTQFENHMTTSLTTFGDEDHGASDNHWEDMRTKVIQLSC